MKRITETVLVVLSSIVVLSSCSKDEPDPVVLPTTPTVTVSSNNQFTGDIDGTAYSYVEGTSDVYSALGKNSIAMGTASYDSFLYFDASGNSIFAIEKGTLSFNGQKPTDSDFKNFFTVTNYGYSVDAVSGFMIDWFDANQTKWSTSLGAATQSNSTISIDEIEEVNASGAYFIKAKFSFTCTLYDGNGNSKQLTNGVYIGTFENI